jgi:DoxX-like family
MTPASTSTPAARWTGRVLTALAVLFFVFDGVTKLIGIEPVVASMTELGFSPATAPILGVLMLACTLVYVIPASSVLGAVLLTGYLGGAIATHVRVGNPLFSHVLFPVYLGVFVWAGLLLREPRLRAFLIPGRAA